MIVPAEFYLILATILFFIGVFGFFTRRNLISLLVSTELMLNAVDINFAVFNAYSHPEHLEGFFFTMFGIGIAAAETAVAIAIIINVFRNAKSIHIKNLRKLKH
ncbi:MAG: NADH-quinone oxidoreductase subunit NuoK [Bacteroidaceae bacterium]|nr:NADH-quinone oxidoreductase subunit NuoK [Bacteroidaceae bacterium]